MYYVLSLAWPLKLIQPLPLLASPFPQGDTVAHHTGLARLGALRSQALGAGRRGDGRTGGWGQREGGFMSSRVGEWPVLRVGVGE